MRDCVKAVRRGTPRMTLVRAVRSEALRMRRSLLAGVHVACALGAGVACGAYFSVAPWDPLFGADAYLQCLGALMPLMAGIVCGLAMDAERQAGGLANLMGVPSRTLALMAKLTTLVLAGAGALALAVGVFGVALHAAGRLAACADTLALAWAGAVLGSAVLYVLMVALSLRFGRNVAIAVGAAGTFAAFLSVGGLAHGLMTGELTAASTTVLGWLPFAWPARLASLAIEGRIALGTSACTSIVSSGYVVGLVAACAFVAALCALVMWFGSFEGGRSDA